MTIERRFIKLPVLLAVAVMVAFAAVSATFSAHAESDAAPPLAPDGISVLGISYLDGNRMMFSFNLGSEDHGGEYHARIGVFGPRQFECIRLEQYPNRIYCIGPQLPEGMIALVQLVISETGQVVIETRHSTPVTPKPEPDDRHECKEPIYFYYKDEVVGTFYGPCQCEVGPKQLNGLVKNGEPLTGCDRWQHEFDIWWQDMENQYYEKR